MLGIIGNLDETNPVLPYSARPCMAQPKTGAICASRPPWRLLRNHRPSVKCAKVEDVVIVQNQGAVRVQLMQVEGGRIGGD